KILHTDPGQIHPRERRFVGFEVTLSRLPDYLNLSILKFFDAIDNTFIYRPCSKASAYNEQRTCVGRKPEMRQRPVPLFTRTENILPHRIARDHNLVFREVSFHPFIGHAYATDFSCNLLVRQAGE